MGAGVCRFPPISPTPRASNSNAGLDQYGVIFNGENAASAGAYNGFMGAWNGAEIPSQIAQNPDGSVDVNGDGLSNGVFMGSQNIGLYDITTQRKRQAGERFVPDGPETTGSR